MTIIGFLILEDLINPCEQVVRYLLEIDIDVSLLILIQPALCIGSLKVCCVLWFLSHESVRYFLPWSKCFFATKILFG